MTIIRTESDLKGPPFEQVTKQNQPKVHPLGTLLSFAGLLKVKPLVEFSKETILNQRDLQGLRVLMQRSVGSCTVGPP